MTTIKDINVNKYENIFNCFKNKQFVTSSHDVHSLVLSLVYVVDIFLLFGIRINAHLRGRLSGAILPSVSAAFERVASKSDVLTSLKSDNVDYIITLLRPRNGTPHSD
jgi:hypothetical protein